MSGYRFKIADTEGELEQVHRLNHRTFAEEMGQLPPDPSGRLVDPFHAENAYAVCLAGTRVVGMVCARDRRPFSLDRKLPDLDAHLPPHRTAVEIRLLAVEREHRTPQVLRGLLRRLAAHCVGRGHDLAVISGYLGQARLYEHLGFVPFGPLVGTPPALFRPMYLDEAAFRRLASRVDLVPGASRRGRAPEAP